MWVDGMSGSHDLAVRPVDFVLPVRLSPDARREALLRTGDEPTAEQILVVKNLTDLVPVLRSRLVQVWERIDVDVDASEMATPLGTRWGHVRSARTDRYARLRRNAHGRWTYYPPVSGMDPIDVDEVFFPGDGTTVDTLARLRATMDPASCLALDAMLDGAPLVTELGDDSSLNVEYVLDAYTRALDLAQRLVELIESGTRSKSFRWFRDPYEITEAAIFLNPRLREREQNRPAAILNSANPRAYADARELLSQLASVPEETVVDKVDQICGHWWSLYSRSTDTQKVEGLIRPAVANALDSVRLAAAEREAAERYEQCRLQWIEKHGSQRLKRAAARGYRHDGIYRDERLTVELPGFLSSLGRKPSIRELVNPSDRALECEAQVLARTDALGIADEQVRLVYAQPGDDVDWADGEFVQIKGYLGRHTVWRSVSGERVRDDDIPF